MKKIFKKTLNVGAWCTEKVVSELDLISALASTTCNGNYVERVAEGIWTPIKVIGQTMGSYISNEGVRDVVNNSALNIMSALGDVSDNIQNHPSETLYAALATYGVSKLAPYISKKIRKGKKLFGKNNLEKRI